MQNISDKELDQLFKQRFETDHVNPSDAVWNKIAGRLDNKKSKGSSSAFWMAAASVVLIVSAGLWLYRPVEVIKLQGKAGNEIAVANPVLNKDTLKESTGVKTVAEEIESINKQERSLVRAVKNNPDYASAVQEKCADRNNAAKQDDVQLINRPEEKLTQVNNDPLSEKQDIKVQTLQKEEETTGQSALIAQANERDKVQQGSPRKRIRSIGGLVNLVIAQVDKREDKIIEFKDGDEGSEVTGINLGLVKYKIRNK
ncbi:MAG: hypothetical protein WBP45_07585 [Daejeonella sp.]